MLSKVKLFCEKFRVKFRVLHTVPPPSKSPEKRTGTPIRNQPMGLCSSRLPDQNPQIYFHMHRLNSPENGREPPPATALPPLRFRRLRPSPTQPSTPSCSESPRDQTLTIDSTGRRRNRAPPPPTTADRRSRSRRFRPPEPESNTPFESPHSRDHIPTKSKAGRRRKSVRRRHSHRGTAATLPSSNR